MTLREMYELNKKATRAFFEKIKDTTEVEIVEFDEGIKFKYRGHTFLFTAELED